MKRSQKIFIAIMLVFFTGIILLAIDISRKTTFPGSKKRTSTQDTTAARSNPAAKTTP